VPDIVAGLGDGGTVLWLHTTPRLRTATCRIGGFPVVVVAVTSSELTAADYAVARRSVGASSRLKMGLLVIHHAVPEVATGNGRAAVAQATAAVVDEFRRSTVPKICLITGTGNVLGSFALGGRQLGLDYTVAWPWARVGVHAGDDGEDGPWLAAGMGLIDDVLNPEETRERLMTMFDILAPALALPTLEHDRAGRLVDDISKV
jgi:acetyl-CoA carboxylase carboxyltransferase component